MTHAQRRALATYWCRYGIDDGEVQEQLDLDRVFGRRAPRYVEIGFGMGEALVEMAQTHPERDYLGVDVYDPGIGRLLAQLAEGALQNVRVIRGDAVDVLERRIPHASLDAVLVFFPDPWPKKRHRKRRLVQPSFAVLIAAKLKPGGRMHLATDWDDYAEHMLTVLETEPRLVNVAGRGRFLPGRGERPRSRFERRGERLGHPVRDLLFEKVAPGPGTPSS